MKRAVNKVTYFKPPLPIFCLLLISLLLFGCTESDKVIVPTGKVISAVNDGNLVINGDVTVDGNFYNKMPHLFGIADTQQSLNVINTWKAVDWNFLRGDSYGFSTQDSNCLVVQQTGHYFAQFELQFQDGSPAPNSDIGVRITQNGVAVDGSYSEIDTTIQDSDVQVETFTYIEASANDVLCLEWISNDIDVSLFSDSTFNGGEYAKGFIDWVHPDGM
jgi:hypothetical protein